jgi:dolichol-phosphate mannosyltransferase
MHDEVSAVDLSRAKVTAGMDIGARGASAAVPLRPHVRLLHGMRRPANWVQLVQFGMVGGLGFVINLGVFALCERGVGIPYLLAYAVAWLVAVSNNFLLNRRFTFNEHAKTSRIHFQAIRFVLVSAAAAAFGALLLALLVEVAGVAKVPAEALAVAASTPLNFLGNKLWSFRPQR